jgi:hypothetical protein
MVDRDEIEALGLEQRHPRLGVLGHGDIEAPPAERALGQTAQAVVVVDIQDPRERYCASTSGTWITARNSPSWRIASAKLS